MTDWYRNTDWSPEISAEFHARLARARSQRDQYLVLQAYHLADTHPETALELTDLYLETRSNDDDLGRCNRVHSKALLNLGRHAEVIESYAKALDAGGAQPFMIVGSVIEYAWLVTRYRSTGHYANAWDRIAELALGRMTDPLGVFKYHAARALLLEARGSVAAARVDAATALEAAAATGAGPAQGQAANVGADQAEVVWRLRQLTRR